MRNDPDDLRSNLPDVSGISLNDLENFPPTSIILTILDVIEDDRIQDDARFCSVLGHD
jgi:hypothetical protein